MSTNKVVTLLLILVLASDAARASDADAFGARRFPVMPELIKDENAGLCAIVLRQAREVFFSRAPTLRLPAENRDGMEWLDWKRATQIPVNLGGMSLVRIDLDIDGDGTNEVVLSRLTTRRGFEHYDAYIVRSVEAFNRIQEDEAGIVGLLTPEYRSSSDKEPMPKEVSQFFPSARTTDSDVEIRVGDALYGAHLFRWKGRYFFHDHGNRAIGAADGSVVTYLLGPDGKVERQCAVAIPGGKKLVDNFRSLPGLASLIDMSRSISGSGRDFCNSIDGIDDHYRAALLAIGRAAIRPWATSSHWDEDWTGGYYVYDQRLLAFLNDWGLSGVWNRRQAQTFPQHFPPANMAMQSYLRDVFGISDTRIAASASKTVEDLIAAWFLVSNGYEPGIDLYSLDRSELADSIMKRDAERLRVLLEIPQVLQRPYQYLDAEPSTLSQISRGLFDAVTWRTGLRMLLNARADVNARNTYDKTPLMMAAHMNRPDAVAELLSHGANPNARTRSVDERCYRTIEVGERAALMYAAENSGTKVMRLLREAGADASSKDSSGRGIDSYLQLNPRFTAAEQQLGVAALIKSKRNSEDAAGFNCQRARTRIEKTICSNEILRMEDAELGSAYERLRGHIGSAAVVEQRDWLRERGRHCSDHEGEQEVGCLQDFLQARTRYLHNRLAEFSSNVER